MKKLFCLSLTVLFFIEVSVTACSTERSSQDECSKFNNPVTSFDWPDPTVWYSDGHYYSVATGVGTILTSTDMVNWKKMNSAPLKRSALEIIRKHGSHFWAPDVVKVGEKWMMYLTCYNSDIDCSIAALSSDYAYGPFEWVGIITSSKDTGIKDTIDPEVVYDEKQSKLWLFFGSVGRIHRVQLSDDGCSLARGAEYVPVAGLSIEMDKTRGKVFEGSYLFYHGGFWYLFVSSGNYNDSSYRIKVGRSASLDGEFLDKEGKRMLDGHASTVLSSEDGDRFYGPGHNGEIFTDQRGQHYIFFHCHDKMSNSQSRFTFLQRIFWDTDGWPYFETGKPKYEETAPVISCMQ